MSRSDERGQTTVLIVGLTAVLLMAVALVVDVTAAYLQRQGLASVADGAALAAADAGSRNDPRLYGEGIGARERLVQQRELARAAVAEHVRATGAGRAFPGLSWEVGFDPTGDRVVVEVRAPLELPLSLPGAPQRASISAEAAATVVLD